MTAGAHGCRALAVSIGAAESVFWETAVPVVEQSLPLLLELDRAVVLNVNVPNVPVDELRGLKQGSLAAFGMVQTTIDQRGEGFVRLSVAAIESELESGTDAALVAAGFASVTPLEPLCEVADLRLRLEPNPQPTS